MIYKCISKQKSAVFLICSWFLKKMSFKTILLKLLCDANFLYCHEINTKYKGYLTECLRVTALCMQGEWEFRAGPKT